MFLKWLFSPQNDNDVKKALPFLYIVFFLVLACGYYFEIYLGVEGAVSASGGVGLAVSLSWSALLLRPVFDAHWSSRLQRHVLHQTENVVEMFLCGRQDLPKGALEKHSSEVDARRAELNDQVDETGSSLKKLFVADTMIIFVGTLVWALGGYID